MNLKTLESGQHGAESKTPVKIHPDTIVALSRMLGTRDLVDEAFPSFGYSITLSIAKYIAGIADEIERQEGKPIANRPRDFSNNVLIPEDDE